MTAIRRNWRNLLIRSFWYAAAAYFCVGVAMSLYEGGSGASVGAAILIGSLTTGVAIYFLTARRLLDRIAARQAWHPFLRDMAGLACFLIVVGTVSLALHFGIKFAISSFAPGASS